MIEAEAFIAAAARRGFGVYSGVPCSYLTPFINHVISSRELRYVAAANEGDAVAIGAGAFLGGGRAVVMFQNSGLGNAVNPLTSLTYTFRLPVLLIVTWRGEPGGARDEPQHGLMGRITTTMLESMEIPWEVFPDSADGIEPALDRALAHFAAERRPYALVMRKGSVSPTKLDAPARPAQPRTSGARFSVNRQHTREAMLRAIQQAAQPDDILIATTGYTGRELCALGDHDSQLYMVGSMGCALSLGLGIAIERPAQRVVVVDGDGALLMRLGALSTLGIERPDNLVHVLLDNGIHESTGGQRTASSSVDFGAVAEACGYPAVSAAADPEQLRAEIAWRSPGLRFVYVPTLPGVSATLPRPAIQPEAVATRLSTYLAARD